MPANTETNRMSQETDKEVLTTGEVARICHVAPRTVSKWFDSGKLQGYRIPGSRDRRIPRRQLLAFMRAYGIPTDGLEDDRCRILVVDRRPPEGLVEAMNASQRFNVRTAGEPFAAGVIARDFHPQVVVVHTCTTEDATGLCGSIRRSEALETACVVVTGDSPAAPPGDFFDHYLQKPYTCSQLIRLIEQAIDVPG